jgi:hypothetical protein
MDLGSGIRKKPIPDPGSRGQKGTGSRIRICNTDFFETLKLYSQETAQNFEKDVLQKCLRIAFYTYIPVNLYNFLKKHYNRCTLFFFHH